MAIQKTTHQTPSVTNETSPEAPQQKTITKGGTLEGRKIHQISQSSLGRLERLKTFIGELFTRGKKASFTTQNEIAKATQTELSKDLSIFRSPSERWLRPEDLNDMNKIVSEVRDICLKIAKGANKETKTIIEGMRRDASKLEQLVKDKTKQIDKQENEKLYSETRDKIDRLERSTQRGHNDKAISSDRVRQARSLEKEIIGLQKLKSAHPENLELAELIDEGIAKLKEKHRPLQDTWNADFASLEQEMNRLKLIKDKDTLHQKLTELEGKLHTLKENALSDQDISRLKPMENLAKRLESVKPTV